MKREAENKSDMTQLEKFPWWHTVTMLCVTFLCGTTVQLEPFPPPIHYIGLLNLLFLSVVLSLKANSGLHFLLPHPSHFIIHSCAFQPKPMQLTKHL